jgi:hypothetical protein
MKNLSHFPKTDIRSGGFYWKFVDYVDKPTFLKGSSFENA